jgi:hypothetical protein
LKLDVSVFDISDGLHLYAALHDETNIIVWRMLGKISSVTTSLQHGRFLLLDGMKFLTFDITPTPC